MRDRGNQFRDGSRVPRCFADFVGRSDVQRSNRTRGHHEEDKVRVAQWGQLQVAENDEKNSSRRAVLMRNRARFACVGSSGQN